MTCRTWCHRCWIIESIWRKNKQTRFSIFGIKQINLRDVGGKKWVVQITKIQNWRAGDKKRRLKQKTRYSKLETRCQTLTWHNEKRFMNWKKKHISNTYIFEQWKSSPQNREHKSSSSHSIVHITKPNPKKTHSQHVKYLFRTTFSLLSYLCYFFFTIQLLFNFTEL